MKKMTLLFIVLVVASIFLVAAQNNLTYFVWFPGDPGNPNTDTVIRGTIEGDWSVVTIRNAAGNIVSRFTIDDCSGNITTNPPCWPVPETNVKTYNFTVYDKTYNPNEYYTAHVH